MQKFSKQTLINHINNYVGLYAEKPTIKQLYMFINSSIKESDYETYEQYRNNLMSSDSVLKYYVKIFSLDEYLNKKSYKKKTEQTTK